MRVVAHYACRNRNNKRGGKLSEHAKGNAIDIAAFTLKNGETEKWRDHHRAQGLAQGGSWADPETDAQGRLRAVWHGSGAECQ